MIDSIKNKYRESFLKQKVKGYEDCPPDDLVAKHRLAAQIDFSSDKIAGEFISFCVAREFEEKQIHFQNILIEEYRGHNPQFADFTDEQLRLMCPISTEEIDILHSDVLNEFLSFISSDIKELQESIAFTEDKLNDPKTFSNELSEYRHDLFNDERKLILRKAEEKQILKELERLKQGYVL